MSIRNVELCQALVSAGEYDKKAQEAALSVGDSLGKIDTRLAVHSWQLWFLIGTTTATMTGTIGMLLFLLNKFSS